MSFIDVTEDDYNPFSLSRRTLGVRKERKDPTRVEGTATEVVKEKIESESTKQLELYKKTYDKHIVALKAMSETINSLHHILKDSEARMQADCVDDVYSMKHMEQAVMKISKQLSLYANTSVEALF